MSSAHILRTLMTYQPRIHRPYKYLYFVHLVLVRVIRVSLISVVQTITALGGSTDKDGEDGEFHFNLEMFIDEEMDFPVDNDHTTSIGDTLFFKLSQKHPVNGLIFSIDGITYLI